MDVSKASHLVLILLRGQHSVWEEFTSKISTIDKKNLLNSIVKEAYYLEYLNIELKSARSFS